MYLKWNIINKNVWNISNSSIIDRKIADNLFKNHYITTDTFRYSYFEMMLKKTAKYTGIWAIYCG